MIDKELVNFLICVAEN